MWKNIVKPGRPLMTLWLAHGHCVLDTSGYRHTFRICNTHCFSSATIVASILRYVVRYTSIGGLVCAVMHYHNARRERTGYKEIISNFHWMFSSFSASVAVTEELQVTEA